MIVKVCGITNRDDAIAAAEAGASAIGFNFYRDSPRYISPTGAATIAEKLPASVWKVGVFVNESAEAVAKVALDAGLDIAQLHGTAQARGIGIWRARPASDTLIEDIANDDDAEAILVDAPSADQFGGTGATFDWRLARCLPKNIVIAGGLDASNVRLAIEKAQPWGVDACSRIEKSPGLKDRDKMTKFVKAALGL
jgi:phosphoribosylanthranilate isomerase